MAGAYNELLLSDTLVPDIFMVQYMPALKKDSISLYLWSLMTFKKGSFSFSEVRSYSVISEDDIKDALADLVANGLLVRESDFKFTFIDLKQIEVEDYIKHGTDSDGIPLMKSEEKSRNLLANSIQKTYYLGYMSFPYYRLIDKCLFDYKFENEVVYSLFEEGRDLKIHFNVQKMYNLASRWYEKGYITKDSLNDYFNYKNRRTACIKLLGKLTHRRLNELDYERIDRMTSEYGADAELIEYAFTALEYRGEIKIYMVEDKIKEWYVAGITTIDKAKIYEEERHQENKAKATKKRGRTNTRRTGKEAGITVDVVSNTSEDAKVNDSEPEVKDSILDMFSGVDI
ncbi:MAG: DnaD domain protein [Saccharofermentans sp.]|nr:DnaD domain protein [Saccharofermentans sp.]